MGTVLKAEHVTILRFCSLIPWLVGPRLGTEVPEVVSLVGGFPVPLPQHSRTCLAWSAAGSDKRAAGEAGDSGLASLPHTGSCSGCCLLRPMPV